MLIRNFRDVELVNDFIIAKVDVKNPFLFWKKPVEKTVYRPRFGYFWKFFDNGKWTPGFDIERAYLHYQSKRQMEKVDD